MIKIRTQISRYVHVLTSRYLPAIKLSPWAPIFNAGGWKGIQKKRKRGVDINIMASTDENSNAVLQGIARHINCLAEENRNTRKRALEGIRKDTLQRKPSLEKAELQTVFCEVLKPVLKSFSDPVERCRELSICIVSEFLDNVQSPGECLPYVLPVIVQRLGQPEITEPSEELRLLLVEMLSKIVILSGEKMMVYLDDSVRILQRTIQDPFPEVKKESCKCASKVARAIPQHFHMQSESLIKPLITAISHQHSRVRVCVIEAVGDVIQYGNGKSVDDVVSHLAQRLFDPTPLVRQAVTKVTGNWLLDLPDRYSFFYKLMPLLLTGLRDEQPTIRELADTYWHDIGIKYARENEDELKDKMDFGQGQPSHYPPSVERPNFGCRTLMMRNVSKILPGLVRDLGDWVADTRIKSASLLYTLLINCEDYITQHMEILLSGLYKASLDEEKQVVADVQKAATVIGYFVKPEVWCKLMLPSVKSAQSYGPLMVMASIISGSEHSQLKPYLHEIAGVLVTSDVCQTVQPIYQKQLLRCVQAVMTVSGRDCQDVSLSLFTVILTVLTLQQDAEVKDEVEKCFLELCKAENLDSRAELFRRHTKDVIQCFTPGYTDWTTHSVDRYVFDVLLLEAGSVVGELLDYIIPVFLANLNPDKEPEVRLKFFTLLSKLMMDASTTVDSRQQFGDFGVTVVEKMILPNCTWRAGRVAGAIRTIAMSCLWALLQSGALTKQKLAPLTEDMITPVLSLMDDDTKGTRLVSCRVMTRIFDMMGTSVEQDRLHNMYPELLKRLDDSSDEIRVTVARTFMAYFGCFHEGYDAQLYKAHLEAIYRGLLVHLDDPDTKIQEAIMDVLKEAGKIQPSMLIQEVDGVKHKHRSPKYCNDLLEYANTLSS